ncbi:bacterial low temperature requirement A protein-domain-containing protein [Fennellomyces sp. T-0311]|nr:bacterial low temperature requirement A protein-domain-containing protein [Fennellomyces sp. T-0311]
MTSRELGRGLTIGRHVRHRSNGSRPSAHIEEDGEEFIEVRNPALSRQSSRSSITHASSLRRPTSAHGRPMRRHGHETFGEAFLHPIKEYELHRQRVQDYNEEKRIYEQNHDPEQGASPTPTVPEPEERKPLVRTMIHLRHLMGGDEQLRITKHIVDHLKEPLELTDKEILQLYKITDTDDLIEFFHKSGRDYSLKIHKTVNRKKRTSGDDDGNSSSSSSSDEEDPQPEEKETPEAPPPIVTLTGDDMIIELNGNVYLEVKKYFEEVEEHEMSRRPIFELPDPDLSDEIGEETSASWLELFGDVFYVGFLATFTHEHHIIDSEQLGLYASWFVVVWWTWCAGALYSSRYEKPDVVHHIYKIIELCGLVGMAGASANFWNSAYGFIIGYMVMKAVLLVQYSVVLWAAIMSHSFSKWPLAGYVAVHALALVLWGVSLLFTENRGARFALWYVSIFLEVAVHIYLKRHKQVSLAASHLGERFALFTLIVLGENCMGFIRAVMESGTEVRVVVANMFGVVIIFLFFFMYFDDFNHEVMSSDVQLSQLWMYLHFPLHLCQVAFGIALSDTISIYSEGGAETLEAAAAHLVSSWVKLAAAVEPSAEEGGHEAASAEEETGSHIDPSYVYKSFWVMAGLILIINALIKLINTPVVGAKWSRIICAARVLNGVVFFALTATSYDDLNGLAILGIMVACLCLQTAIDLLD